MVINLWLLLICLILHIILYKFKSIIFGKNFLDIPNSKRKIHKIPTYLIGGYFIFFSYALFLIFSYNINLEQKVVNLIVYLIIFFIGTIDDLNDIKPATKLTSILIIYLILTSYNETFLLRNIYFETFEKNISFGIYSYFISSLCVLLLINSINLIDGVNGLAMMIFIIWLGFLHYFIGVNFNIFQLIFYLFVFFNIYKGRYFLGNSGSLIIGAIISFSCIKYYNLNFVEKNSAEDIFILFLIPGIDMLRLFVQRLLKKRNPFKADSSHLHHLLIKKFSLNKVLFFYFITIILSSYLAFNDYVAELVIIIFTLLLYFSTLLFLKKS